MNTLKKGCFELPSVKRLNSLKKQQDKLREVIEKAQREMKEVARKKVAEESGIVFEQAKKTGFPMENTALLIGVLLEGKSKIDSHDNKAVNRYIAFYKEFADKNGIPMEEAEDSSIEDEDVDDVGAER